jgi:hypothetical protein
MGDLRILDDNELDGKDFTVSLGTIGAVLTEPRHGGGARKSTMNSTHQGCTRYPLAVFAPLSRSGEAPHANAPSITTFPPDTRGGGQLNPSLPSRLDPLVRP